MPGEIRRWLAELGLEAYADPFEQNDIDLDLACDLQDEDLKELGVASLGHRKRLLRGIVALKAARTEPPSPGAADATTIGERAASSASAGPAVAPAPSQADRRQLTVMFCDLADSTALSTRLDPEDYRDLIRAYQDACTAAVVRYGGYLARYMGDGVLAYFGWPNSHEDDAERAINAGLGIVDAVGALTPPKGETNVPAVRIGIATGPVVVGDIVGEGAAQEAAATGITPNLAARLQSIAEPNSVVISASTRALVRDLFSYESLGARDLKGIGRAVEAWRVTGTGVAGSRFEAVHGDSLTPLVGREHELSLLRDRWEAALAGEGQVVVLSGEAGIGKSRLTQALMDYVQAAPHFRVRFQCSPYEANSAFNPVIRQLERAASFLPGDSAHLRLDRLESLLRQGGESKAENMALIANLLMLPLEGRYPKSNLSPQQAKQRTLDVLCNQVFGLARERPVLFLCEDGHWIDPSSLELLEMVVQRAPGSRMFVIVTQRPEWHAPFLDQTHVTLLQLSRLGRRQIAEIIRYVAAAEVPDSVVEDIIGRTDGIPLFVEEMTRTIVEAGFELGRAAEIPDTLQASLTARLDRLPDAAKSVAQVAAVIGREVPLPLLATVVGEDPARITKSIEDLSRSQLVLRAVTSGEPRLIFRHALIRDAAYQSLLISRRRDIHRRIATTILEAFPQLAEGQPELVARHFAEAGEALSAAGYWRRAGERATELMASYEAVDHFRNALAQLERTAPGPARDANELQILLEMGVPLIAATGYASDEVRQAYNRARELSQIANDADGLFTSTRGLWNCVYDRAELDDALDLATTLVRLAGSRPDRQALAQRALGSTYMNRGAFDDAVAAFDLCLAKHEDTAQTAQIGDHVEAPYIIALQYKGFVRCLQGRPGEGLALVGQAVEHARKLRHALALAFALHMQSTSCLLVREFGPSREAATETLALAKEHGLVFWIAGSKITLGCASVHLDPSSPGLDISREGLREWLATAAKLHIPTWSSFIADAALSAGDLDTAGSAVTGAVRIAESNHDVIALADLQRLQGETAVRRGDPAGGKIYLEAAIATARQQGAHLFGLRAATSLVRILLDDGEKEEARRVLEPMVARFADDESFPDLIDARRTLAG